MEEIHYLEGRPDPDPASTALMSEAELSPVLAFHRTLPEYRPTSLVLMPALGRELGVGTLMVKDESDRFGLGAFKGLGGVWAMARLLADDLGVSAEVGFPRLSQSIHDRRGPRPVFVTATAANHGRGVAWAARIFGCDAVVFVPEHTRASAIAAIRGEGARVEVRGRGFDDVVGHARRAAAENGWTLLQDTAWEGYTRIPEWVLQGYGTMVIEALDQAASVGVDPPTHVFLQVGVGSFAAAVTACLTETLGSRRPAIFTTEPTGSAPLLRSIEAGAPVTLEATAPTVMSCLDCSAASPQALPILRDHCVGHFAGTDAVAEVGQRTLASGTGGDPVVDSGASGALGAGTAIALASRPELEGLRRKLGLDRQARILVISTEGRPPDPPA